MLFSLIFLSLHIISTHAAAPIGGFVKSATINNQTFKGYVIERTGLTDNTTPIRPRTSRSATPDTLTASSITCGKNSNATAAVASASPGDLIEFQWAAVQGTTIVDKWPESSGPIISWIASCNGPCSQVTSPSTLDFYKFDEQVASSTNPQVWQQKDFESNKPVVVKLPDNLPDGQYLLRHEVISFQSPVIIQVTCLQLEITDASPSAVLPSNSLARRFPGGYSKDDPGFKPQDSPVGYTAPGGSVVEFGEPNSDGATASTLPSLATTVASTTRAKTSTLAFSSNSIPTSSAAATTTASTSVVHATKTAVPSNAVEVIGFLPPSSSATATLSTSIAPTRSGTSASATATSSDNELDFEIVTITKTVRVSFQTVTLVATNPITTTTAVASTSTTASSGAQVTGLSVKGHRRSRDMKRRLSSY